MRPLLVLAVVVSACAHPRPPTPAPVASAPTAPKRLVFDDRAEWTSTSRFGVRRHIDIWCGMTTESLRNVAPTIFGLPEPWSATLRPPGALH